MLSGTFALLERSLRIDARGWSAHLARVGLMAAIYFALCFALATQNMFGAPGLRFFEGIAYLDIAFMTLLGISFFSSAITEEKEEDTLGLMLMAGISPLGILAGKTGGRLWQAILLLAVQYPFVLLAVTMGGVAVVQIWALTIALVAYAILLAGLGLLCSTITPRSRTAATFMFVGLASSLVVSMCARWVSWKYQGWLALGGAAWNVAPEWMALLKGIGDSCIVVRMSDILTTGFDESAFSVQAISNGAIGMICAGLSWSLFGLATRSPSTEATSRGLVARRRDHFRFNADRPRNNPFIWKDFHFVAGGIGWILVRTVLYGTFALGIWLVDLSDSQKYSGELDLALILFSLAICIDAGLLLSRSIHDEIRNQTLSTLMMLPRSSVAMMYAKFGGALLGWLPGPILELVVTLMTRQGRHDLWFLLGDDPPGGYMVVALFATIPHFSALMATIVRWGAVAMGIGLSFGVYFAIIGIFVFYRGPGPDRTMTLLIAIVLLFICLCCHLAVLLRIQALGTK